MAADGTSRKKRAERLEDRFEFQGDGVSVSDGQALRSTLFRVVERGTDAERALRVWRKTGTAADRDLRQLWEHERRQVQRLMFTAGAAELVVNVLEFVEYETEFGVVLEDAGIPLSRLRETANRHHWLRYLGVVANRIILWRNFARMAQALGLLHAQGIIHGQLRPSAIMTHGDRVPDFKLTGFEWSLWFAAPTPADGQAGVVSRDTGTLAACSFATDWLCLGTVAADLLGIVVNQEGIPVARDESIELIPSERALIRRLLSPARNEALDAGSVAGAIDDIVAELERSGAVHTGAFLLLIPDTSRLGEAVSRATRGAVEADDHIASIEWAQADISGGADLIVPAAGIADRPAYLMTQVMRYELRASRAHGEEPTWRIAYSSAARLRDETGGPQWPVEVRAVTQPIEVIGIPRSARERRDRLGPAALDWEVFLRPPRAPVADSRLDVRHALILIQAVEAVGRSLDALPIEIIASNRVSSGCRLIVRAKPDNDRDAIARALSLPDTAEALRRILTEEQREGEEGWALSPSAALGGSQWGNEHATFVREVTHQGVLGYEFDVDEEVDRAHPLFLRSRQDSGSQQVIGRRLRAIQALAEQPGFADFLADPWSARRSVPGYLDEDAAFSELDEAKQEALRRFSTTAPAHLVVGPPGVGKTRLATEVVRRSLAAQGSTRLFLTAQGHDALDNLHAAVRKAVSGLGSAAPMIVRAASEARPDRADDASQHVSDILRRMAASPALSRLPPPFMARVQDLAVAAQKVAKGASAADKARAGLWSTADVVMDAADVVLATTNSSVVDRLVGERASFDTVIVEEAAKATGPELIGPLLLSGRRLLIGDHNQLPPFDAAALEGILSSHALTKLVLRDAENMAGALFPSGELDGLRDVAASETDMERVRGMALRLVQFFKTVAEGDEARAGGLHTRRLTSVLDEQRRMHPALAEIVSKAFYGGRLKTAPDRETEAYASPPPFVCSGPLPASPLVVADFDHVMLTGRARSMEGTGRRWTNPDEADAVLGALRHVRATGNTGNPTLAILSPYAAQVDVLARKLSQAIRRGALPTLEGFSPARSGLNFVSTVDSFQGAEADLVVVSLVRNNAKVGFGGLGFLRDARRMNVLLSRARSKLVLVTSLRFLTEAVQGAPTEQQAELAFVRSLLASVEDLKGRSGDDGVPLGAVIRASDLGRLP
jgi:hypothetical protein